MAQPTGISSLKRSRAAVGAVLCLWACAAWSDVYKWVDAKGETHYSDQPPPGVNAATVPLGGRAPDSAAASAAATGSAAGSGSAAAKPGAAADSKTAALRGKMLGVEQVDNSPEAQRQRDEACQRMHTELSLLSGQNRVFTLDANGERSYLDDDTRAARISELQGQLSSGGCQ